MTDWSAYPAAPANGASAPGADPWAAYPMEKRARLQDMIAAGADALHAKGLNTGGNIGGEETRQLGLTARTTASGLMAIPNAIGDAANQAINYGVEGFNALAGTNITPPMRPTSEVTQDSLTRAGLPTPETPIEKGVDFVGQMATSGPGVAGAAKGLEAAGVKGLSSVANDVTGFGNLVKGVGKPSEIPSTQAIKAASQAAYGAAEDAGAIIKPQVMQDLAKTFKSDLADFAYDPALEPKVGVLIDRLEAAGAENITAKGVDTIRKIAVKVARDGNPSERAIAGNLIGKLDDMMEGLTPSDVVMGDSAAAAAKFAEGRDLWRTFRKSELIDNLVTKGEDQALSTNSGGNVQNAIRQKLRGILDNPKTARLFSAEEQDAIRSIVRGTPTQNALRIVGRLAPSSNSWLGPILATMGGGAGYAAGGVPGIVGAAAIPAVGAAAKAGATALTKKAVGNLSEAIRSGAIRDVPLTPPDLPSVYAQILSKGTGALESPYVRALLQQYVGGSLPAIAGPNTGLQNQP